MANPGIYRWKYTWLKCTRTADGTTGDKPKTYASNGSLWGTATFDSATTQKDYGAQRNTESGTIRIREQIAISAIDRILLVRDNLTFAIDSVKIDWDNYETILDVHSIVVV
jgi:hypothetical protein